MKLALNMSPWMKKVAAGAAIAAVFGTLGYFASPKKVKANAPKEDALKQVNQQLKEALAAKRTLEKQLKETKDGLNATSQRADGAAAAVQAEKGKVSAAEKFIADLTGKLDEADHANEPMKQKMEAAQKQAGEAKALAEQTVGRADALAVQVDTLTKDRNSLDETRKRLEADRANLERSLSAQTLAATGMQRLLGALTFGQDRPMPATAALPQEMPVTAQELTGCLGQPTVVLQRRGGETEMQWGKEHTATAADGLVLALDGKPSPRAALAAMVGAPSSVTVAPGPWRYGPGASMHYADLVALWGEPEGTCGAGSKFTAWWSIGAWARSASVVVVDGEVRQFDGRSVNPAMLCELVRHRPPAYQSSTPGVEAKARSAQACYDQAMKVLRDGLEKEASARAKDGLSLARWSVAPFDSVGVWIASTNVPPDTMTVRATVDCTWVAADRTATAQRRYAVVALRDVAGQTETADYAIFAPRK